MLILITSFLLGQTVFAQQSQNTPTIDLRIPVEKNYVDEKVQSILQIVELENDVVCSKDKTPGFFSHFRFCMGEFGLGKPCAKLTVYECRSRASAKVTKKLKFLIRYDDRGYAQELVNYKIKDQN